jgi:hypothetical protein
MRGQTWVLVTLALVLVIAVVATPPAIKRLFDDELHAGEFCREHKPPTADGYQVRRKDGVLTCFYTKNGRSFSMLTVTQG